MNKLVCGVGINDADYVVGKMVADLQSDVRVAQALRLKYAAK